MARNMTMLDLVHELSQQNHSESEVIAKVVTLVNSGAVLLCGNFKGRRFDVHRHPGTAPRGRLIRSCA